MGSTKVHLIGLNGKARSGKDTTAGFIRQWAEDYGFGFAQDAFARRLKESAAAALGIFPEAYDDGKEDVLPGECIRFCEELKEGGIIAIERPGGYIYSISGREFLQWFGTESHRNVFGYDFWVDAVLPKGYDATGVFPKWHESFQIEGRVADFAVVTDVRFPNEARRIKELGGEVWKIQREGAGAGNHASEQELDPDLIDYFVGNNGTLDELHESVNVILDTVTGIDAAMQITEG